MRMQPRNERRRSALVQRGGFTLAEVLVTLMIMSGILVTLTQILTAARSARDMIHNIQENQLAGPAILDLIERDLRGMQTYNRRRADYLRITDRVRAGLDADSLDFVSGVNSLVFTEERDRQLRANMNEVGYRLRPSPQDDDFLEIWRREDFGVDEEPFDGGDFTFLHDRVRGLEILVFVERGDDEEPIEEWGTGLNEEHIGLPHRIEIELTLELSNRIVKERIAAARVGAQTVTYRRVIRFPEALELAQELQPVPFIPKIEPPLLDGVAVGGEGEEGIETGDDGLPDGGGLPDGLSPLDIDTTTITGSGGGGPIPGLGGG